MNQPKAETAHPIESHLATLYGRINYERQMPATPEHFKLRNMKEILRRLENPHLKYPVIHVAGTKGKGSVCTLMGQVLTQSGRRTGVYTSPHLERINQRIAIDGQPISDDQLVEVLSSLEPVIQQMDVEAATNQTRPLTFFEVMTAAAFFHFAKQQCEAVVLEVGLGGRLDSTNVCQPDLSIITNISIDHTKQLGSTVDKIAFEKAGIIKSTVPVVSGATDPLAASVINDVASQRKSPLIVLGHDFEVLESNEISHPVGRDVGFVCQGEFEVLDENGQASTVDFSKQNLSINLLGRHQRINAAIVVAATQVLVAAGWGISDDAIKTGLAKATLSGRTEMICQRPVIIVDMAHNVASILALVETLNEIPGWSSSQNRTLIFATSRDKDAPGMLRPLLKSFDRVLLTKFQNNPRGRCQQELLQFACAIKDELAAQTIKSAELEVFPTPEDAWAYVLNSGLATKQMICVSGSAFLIAEMRGQILQSVIEQRGQEQPEQEQRLTDA